MQDEADDRFRTGSESSSGSPAAAADAAAMLAQRVARLETLVGALSEELRSMRPGPAAPELTAAAPNAAPTAAAAAPPPRPVYSPDPPQPERPKQASPPALQPERTLEDRLGSQVFQMVGIVALIFAAAWFLKLAIEHGYIGPTARVLIGLVTGAGLVVWSGTFRRRGLGAFSYGLKAVGSVVLYLALWAAFQLYHLLPAGAAMAAMIAVTGWIAFIAWNEDAELLAAYALAGGLATPLLLSTGENHEAFLFSYLAAIDLATVWLVRRKPWSRLLLPAFAATVLYFIGWYANFFHAHSSQGWSRASGSWDPVSTETAAFTLLLFAIFALVSVRSWRESGSVRSGASDVIENLLIPLANAAFLGLALYSVMQDSGLHDALVWMVLGLAALWLALMRVQRVAITAGLMLALAVTCLTIAVPLKLHGAESITLGWLIEGLALVWLATRMAGEETLATSADARVMAPDRVLRLLACGALVLGFLGVALLPFESIFDARRTAFLNERFATALAGVAVFAAAAWLASRANDPSSSDVMLGRMRLWPGIAVACILAMNLLALQAGVNEIGTFWKGAGTQAAFEASLSVSGFLMVYGAALLAAGFWRRSALTRWQGLLLLIFTIAKVFLFDVSGLSEGYRVASFLGLGVLLMGVSFAYQRDWLALRAKPAKAGEA